MWTSQFCRLTCEGFKPAANQHHHNIPILRIQSGQSHDIYGSSDWLRNRLDQEIPAGEKTPLLITKDFKHFSGLVMFSKYKLLIKNIFSFSRMNKVWLNDTQVCCYCLYWVQMSYISMLSKYNYCFSEGKCCCILLL